MRGPGKLAALAMVLVGCGSASPPLRVSATDTTTTTTGSGTSGSTTTGTSGSSTGTTGSVADAGDPKIVDAGPLDAGEPDAGPVEVDAGAPDAGPLDAGLEDAGVDAGPPVVSAPTVTCVDSLSDVYITPTLAAMTDANRGDVVRCAFDAALSQSDVASNVASDGLTTAMTSGTNRYRIAFRTWRGNGSEGVSTAVVYLPTSPISLPLPVITIGHPTEGLADSTAPSLDASSNDEIALPFAGAGYAVIVPDYAGLGNEGVQSYLDNHDQGHAILDAARALRKLLPAGAFSQKVLALGFSQGGGSVLSAQALASSYGADGTLVGVVAFAPEWPSRMNSFGYVDMLEHPNELTIETGISDNVVEVMRTYAYFYNYVGATHADDGFPAASRAGIDQAVNNLDEVALGGYLQGTAMRVGDTIDPSLQSSLLACIQQGASSSGCVEPGASYFSFLQNNILTADAQGAPVLMVQGLADYVMPAASEAACNIQKLEADGVTPQVCVDALAQHQTVVSRNADFAIQWSQAILAGTQLPSCSGSGMPACTP